MTATRETRLAAYEAARRTIDVDLVRLTPRRKDHTAKVAAARAFNGALGDPQRAYRSVQVAGTSGKGSVCALIASALILGSVLAVLNQSDEIFGPAHVQWLPLVLVYLTPFIVVTLSQAVGIQRAKRDRAEKPSMELRPGSFVQTMGSHGIPARVAV